MADIGDGHMVRFLVSDFGISWVESRNGRELVKLEGPCRSAQALRGSRCRCFFVCSASSPGDEPVMKSMLSMIGFIQGPSFSSSVPGR